MVTAIAGSPENESRFGVPPFASIRAQASAMGMTPEETAVLAARQLERDRIDLWHREEILRRQAAALVRIALDARVRRIFEALDERELRSMRDICENIGFPFGNGGYVAEWRRLLHDSEPLLVHAPPQMSGPQVFRRTAFCTQFLDELNRLVKHERAQMPTTEGIFVPQEYQQVTGSRP